MKTYKSVEDHINSFPPEVRKNLEEIRGVVKKLVPEAVELINYGIPTFKYKGKNLVHYAAYEHHIGFYPGSEAIEVFKKDLDSYETSKGTIKFPLDKPIPVALIRKIIQYRVSKI